MGQLEAGHSWDDLASLHSHRLSQAASHGREKGLQEAVKVQSFLKLILKTVTYTEFFVSKRVKSAAQI